MPIYEYRCEKGHTFEVMQSMSDDPLTACEICGAPVQKVLHAPAVHFKGSGFYNTDYGKKKSAGTDGKKPDSNGSSDSSAASSGKSEKKSESAKPGSTTKSD